MGWRCCDAVPRLRGHGGSDAAAPATCTGPASPPARMGTVDVCCLHGTAHAARQCAGAGLRLPPAAACNISLRRRLPASAWQLWSPNKSLGLTGVRAAYAVALLVPKGMVPAESCAIVAPWGGSWRGLVGGLGRTGRAAMGADCLPTLRSWKDRQMPCAPNWAGPWCPAAWPTILSPPCPQHSARMTPARKQQTCWPRCANTASSCATAPRLALVPCGWACCACIAGCIAAFFRI